MKLWKRILSVMMIVVLCLTMAPISGLKEIFTYQASASSYNVCVSSLQPIDFDRYTGNLGDSFFYNLNKQGLIDNDQKYYRNGNIGVDESVYENGFEVWIARWNYTQEISWAAITYDIDGAYDTLSGRTGLIKSYNTNNFDTTVYFYGDDQLLHSQVLTNGNYKFDFNIDVKGVNKLKILVQDNVAAYGGTSFALYDLFLNTTKNPGNTSGIMASGKCGDNLTWTLYNDGELVICGNGEMEHYLWGHPQEEEAPWYEYRNFIKKITVDTGVSSIGAFAFSDCYNLESVELADTVNNIAIYAFGNCSKLKSISLPEILEYIGSYAFSNCDNLLIDFVDNILKKLSYIPEGLFADCDNIEKIVIPDNISGIELCAFESCDNLTNVTIPYSVTYIGLQAFDDCDNINTVYYTGSEAQWNSIDIEQNNENLTTANIIFNSSSLPNPNEPEMPYDDIGMKIYSSLPNLNVGKDQEIRFAVSLFEEGTQIESKNGYSVIIKDNAYLETTESYKSGKDQIFVFEGKKEGNTKVSFIENDTKIKKDLTIYISDDCRYFRCENENQPGERWISSICITDFSCSQNNDETQTIKFDAYNTNYSYATAEVYDLNGTFIKSIAISPKTDDSGMEKVINSFKYVYVDITDHTTPWYKKESNSQHTYVNFENLPKNSTIRITSDGKKSNIVTLYTSIDLFVNVVMLASGIEISKDAQKASVNELIKNIVENMPENAIKALASELSTAMLNGSTKEAAENTYNIIYNIFSDIGINYKKILTEVLTKMGYGALDSIVTTLVPSWKIVTAVDDITAMGWELLSYSSFEYGSGEIKIYVANHGLENMLVENGISVSQNEVFSTTTILDAYVVEDSDEFKNLPGGLISGVVYNITLRDKGKEIQPNGSIEVRIPIPKDMSETKCVVYRLETDGTKTEMLTHLDNGYLVFTTDHLSYYEVVSLSSFSLGDITGDGKVTAADARLALRISAKLDSPTEEQFIAADVNGDKKITASDARIILRVAAKLQTF